MPLYDFECEKCGEFEAFLGVYDDEPPCKCGRKAKRLVSRVGLLVTKDGFEENTVKARSQDGLHEARMANKRAVEKDWHKVESGQATYDPGKAPEQYQPRQHLEREKKRLY